MQCDVILMDVQMPGIDGHAATRALRAAGMRTPVLAVTAHAMQAERDRCLEAGCDDFVSKPIDRTLLREKLGRWLDRGRCVAAPAAAGSAPEPGADDDT